MNNMREHTRTLIVGEHPANAEMLTEVLNQLEAGPVEYAPNGAAALVMMHQGAYDLVIAQSGMEPVSGLQLIKFIRAEPALDQVRVLISLPDPEKSSHDAALQAGANGLLIEPYSLDFLSNTISGILRR